jgi:hypothetical protein
LLGLIAVVQVVVTLVDYQFNATMEAALRDVDARTAAIGRVYATIDAGSMVLQLATGPILRALGVRATLLAIPVLLAAAVSAFALSPRALTISIARWGARSSTTRSSAPPRRSSTCRCRTPRRPRARRWWTS